ncbi:MAG: PilZ domain-containing protein [Deltaproteobacteria bacterium]|nr:PilZ domain-containing protein [Deltaproteobacteria bacterium]
MVAAARLAPTPRLAATNLVHKNAAAPERVVDARNHRRARIALRAWLCDDQGSSRAYTLDLSPDGARVGGAGSRFTVGQSLLLKIVLDDAEPPVVLKAELVRYHPGISTPDLCLRFLPTSHVDELYRVARYVAAMSACQSSSAQGG